MCSVCSHSAWYLKAAHATAAVHIRSSHVAGHGTPAAIV